MTKDKLKENETVELKKSTSELKEAIISIVAILNKHGKGQLYFGVKNDGEVVGQNVTENTLREISKAISDHVEPKIYPKINRIDLNGKNYVIVDFEGSEKPYFSYGRAYTRVGDEDRQLSAKELENLFVDKNEDKLRWDDEICEEASLKDIDNETVNSFVKLAKESKRMIITDTSKKTILRKLGLFFSEGLTNAAVVVFGKNSDRFFPNITLKCGRFKGTTEEFADIRDFNGNLFQLLEGALSFFKDHLHVRARIEEFRRKESWEIPIEALREAVLNALIHRDYRKNSFVCLKIHDESITISNPGKLPAEIKIKDLYKEHDSELRNPLIAKIFFLTGYIDTWGKGTINIINLLKENKLSLPTFEENQGNFKIKFKREYFSERAEEKFGEGSERSSEKIIALIKENKHINARQMARIIGISQRAVEKQLAILKDKKIIKRIGPDKGGYWQVR
ncbi:putative DNA binding domain-containing protein [Candidatus Woesearchaeota archaeon]|nr:putative DNA binding domain-containing protein [Candidatus Woesearchaeota archaeon]